MRSSQRPCRKWMAYLHFRHLYQVSSIQRHVQCILLSHTKNSNIRSPRSRVILATSVHGIAVPSCSRAFGMERDLIHVHVRSSAYQVRDILIRWCPRIWTSSTSHVHGPEWPKYLDLPSMACSSRFVHFHAQKNPSLFIITDILNRSKSIDAKGTDQNNRGTCRLGAR